MSNITYINWTNVSDFDQLPILANTVTNGSYWAGIYLMLYVIFIAIFSYLGLNLALFISSFIIMIIGSMLLYSNLISLTVFLIPVGVMLLMVVLILSKRK